MIHHDYAWMDTASHGPEHRNKVLQVGQIFGQLPEDRVDCYATWHRFPDAYRLHAEQRGSTGGYQGPSYADFLPFDFDGEDLVKVLEDVRGFLKELELSYEIDGLRGVRCYFSGKKGFHVCLSAGLFGGWSPSAKLPGYLRGLAATMAGDHKIDTAIYDQNRLLRLTNTQHGDSQLWKIPLETATVIAKSVDQIRKLAKQPQEVEFPDWDDVVPVPPCVSLFASVQKGLQEAPVPQRHVLFPTLKEGEGRDEAAFRIARVLRDGGLQSELALEVLKLWNASQDPPLTTTDGGSVLEKKIRNAYGSAVSQKSERINPDDIRTPAELCRDYSAYIEKLKTRKVTLGWVVVDTTMRGIAPGEVVTIIAKSGVGKTAFLQNIIVHLARQKIVCLFCSMEQPLAQCFERFAQILTSQPGTIIEQKWEEQFGRDTAQFVEAELRHYTLTCGRPGLSLKQLEEALDAAETKAGEPVGVLAIDYMGLLDTHDLDRSLYGQVSRAARELKNLAKRRDLVILLLCQVNRAAGDDGDTPLNLHSARESGAIEESADFLLGLYRPDIKTTNERICLQLLKSRKGAFGHWDFHFDTGNLRITA